MEKEKESQMIVTVRVKQKAADLYKAIMIENDITVTDDLVSHMIKQINQYMLLESDLQIDDKNFSKLNVRVDRDLYKKYKIKMTLNHTTPTADITRYVMHIIESKGK